MFNYRDTKTLGLSEVGRVFVKSTNVNVFPCGRRRGAIDTNHYIPFDPEARLNTEFNNRKAIGVGGFTDTFIKNIDFVNKSASIDSEYLPTGSISLVLAGYTFTITADNTCTKIETKAVDSADYFGKVIEYAINNGTHEPLSNVTHLYANIRLATAPLYEDNASLSYKSWILRDQTDAETPSTSLDICLPSNQDSTDVSKYYFSGLSFSSLPMAYNKDTLTSTVNYYESSDGEEVIISLLILKKRTGTNVWQINQRALLPKIVHGDTVNSVEINNMNITGSLQHKGKSVATMSLTKSATSGLSRLKINF